MISNSVSPVTYLNCFQLERQISSSRLTYCMELNQIINVQKRQNEKKTTPHSGTGLNIYQHISSNLSGTVPRGLYRGPWKLFSDGRTLKGFSLVFLFHCDWIPVIKQFLKYFLFCGFQKKKMKQRQGEGGHQGKLVLTESRRYGGSRGEWKLTADVAEAGDSRRQRLDLAWFSLPSTTAAAAAAAVEEVTVKRERE